MAPLQVEYAKSGRAKCSLTSCKKAIAKHEVRIGTAITLPFGDEGAETVKWRHLCCFTERQLNNARASGELDAIQGYDDLAPADKALVDQMARGELVNRTELIGRVGDVANAPMMAVQLAAPAGKKAAPKAAPRAKAPKKEKAAEAAEDVDSDATEELEVVVRAESARPRCPYGASCFRTAADHFEQFSHEDGEEVGGPSTLRPVIIGKRIRT